MEGSKPTIVVADDHTLIAQGLVHLLEPEYDVKAICSTGRELLETVERVSPNLVVADVSMPELNGIEAIRLMKQRWPDLPCLVLSMHTDVQYVHAALRAGASGYVVKRSAAAELLKAIDTVLSGGRYIPESLQQALTELRDSKDEVLTPRQRQVLQLVSEGNSAKEIAHQIGISVKTVEFHKACIMSKLRLRTTAELTKYAVEHGLTPAQ